MAQKGTPIRRYIVKLTEEERAQLNAMIHSGKHAAKKLLKARILLKADQSEAGDGWGDTRIAEALDVSTDTILTTRQRFVEEGLEGALSRKHSPASARKPIFDGAAEAKLIALACSEPPQGRARWTLHLLEEKVVELGIVEKASDNTISRVLKKPSQTASETAVGDPTRSKRRIRFCHGRCARCLSPASRSGASRCVP